MRLSSAILTLAAFSLTLLLVALAPARAATRTRHILEMIQPELKFTDVPLSEALDYIRDTAGVDMLVDWKSLEAANIDRATLINVHLHHVTLRKGLATVLNEAGAGNLLTFYVEDNILNITTQAKADTMLFTKVYDVQDLLVTIPNFQLQDVSNVLNSAGSGGGGQTVGGTGGASTGSTSSNTSSLTSGGNSSSSSEESPADLGAELVTLIRTTIRPEIWSENGGAATIRFYHGLLIVNAPISVLEAIGGPVD